MATIATSIVLADNISASLHNITNSLNLTLAAFQGVQNTAAHDIDVASFDAAREHLNSATIAAQQFDRGIEQATQSRSMQSLNTTIDAAGQNIRENIGHQQRFNAELRNGVGGADLLMKKIGGIAAAYMSIQGAGRLLSLSDTMAQNTARLNLIVDDGGSVQELQNKIFRSAQRTQTDYLNVTETITRLGLLAGRAFTSNDEVIAFTEQMNKNFMIGGASIQEQTSAMYQLTQAMASGRLQGDEYRSIIENAPLLANAIEDYMTNAGFEGTMKEWASDGLLTADVIKNALFSVADETNARFESMPLTFAQIATNIKNNALMVFQPILTRLNEIANSDRFKTFASDLTISFVRVRNAIMGVMNVALATGSFIADNWSIIAPAIYAVATALVIYIGYMAIHNAVQAISNGLAALSAARSAIKAGATLAEAAATKTATGAQVGLNAALLASPFTWVILAVVAIIALFYAVVGAINKFAGTSLSATGMIAGAFAVMGATLYNIFLGIVDFLFGCINYMANQLTAFANFFANVFENPISSVINLFRDLATNVLGIIESIARAIDHVFGSNLASAVAGWQSGIGDLADKALERFASDENYQEKVDQFNLSAKDTLGLERIALGDAYAAGYSFGDSLFEAELSKGFGSAGGMGGFEYDPEGLASDVAGINSNTSDLKSASEEDIKYLRDIAERDAINRFTTAEVYVDFGGISNNINNEMDLDGITDYIANGTREALAIVAEGASA